MTKRIFDLILSICGLFVFGALILFCILLASIDTKSIGLFCQNRIGQYGVPFKIFKIKSLNDTTKKVSFFGRFLRASKLDEFPQLFNVLIADMSFVGPRPDVAGYYDLLEGENLKILELKPGITSMASLKYADEENILKTKDNPIEYNDTVIFLDKVKMNLDYYYNKSLLIDIKIIYLTVIKVLSTLFKKE
jgi:lipopolysaccharide/colanic/teichoic acid biosynthesis glycosyltransferase